MKLQSYKILFRLLSFLSNKTNGRPYIVKYKLLLGTIIIGLSTSCSSTSSPSSTNKPTEKAPVDVDETERITCYDPVAPMPEENDTTTPKKTSLPQKDTLIDKGPTCYMPAFIDIEVKEIEKDENS